MNSSREILNILLESICEQGLKEKECLIKCNINTSFLADWKNERLKNPSYDKIVKISEYLNLDLNYVFGISTTNISEDKKRLLSMYDELTDIEKGEILGEMKNILRNKSSEIKKEKTESEEDRLTAVQTPPTSTLLNKHSRKKYPAFIKRIHDDISEVNYAWNNPKELLNQTICFYNERSVINYICILLGILFFSAGICLLNIPITLFCLLEALTFMMINVIAMCYHVECTDSRSSSMKQFIVALTGILLFLFAFATANIIFFKISTSVLILIAFYRALDKYPDVK